MGHNVPPYQQPYMCQMEVQAQPVPAPLAQVRVKLPENSVPGSQCDVHTPDGQTMRITVPQNLGPGGFVTMQYTPKATAPMHYAPAPMMTHQAPYPQQQVPYTGQQPAQYAPQQAAPQVPQAVPAAIPPSNMQVCQTTLPAHAREGEMLRVETPDGCTVEIQVPPGSRPGQTVTFEYARP